MKGFTKYEGDFYAKEIENLPIYVDNQLLKVSTWKNNPRIDCKNRAEMGILSFTRSKLSNLFEEGNGKLNTVLMTTLSGVSLVFVIAPDNVCVMTKATFEK